MSPAEGELHRATLGERAIAGIAVRLQDAGEAGEMDDRSLRSTIGRVDVSHVWRIGTPQGRSSRAWMPPLWELCCTMPQ
jgi:hypothetical protein